ncbi:MAG: DUF935 domain-containing protein [Methanobrevibacter sp.]|jgi:hypothetical protein|nr:DUF935 domain-containing protein [Candidatus Methanovirga basalitermitum]
MSLRSRIQRLLIGVKKSYTTNSTNHPHNIDDECGFRQEYNFIKENCEILPVNNAYNFIVGLLSQQSYQISQDSDLSVFIEDVLGNLDMVRVIKNILYSIKYGFTVQEILYKEENGYIVPVDIVKVQQWTLDNNNINIYGGWNNDSGGVGGCFRYDEESGELIGVQQNGINLYPSNNNNDEADGFIPSNKSLITLYNHNTEQPYGRSILQDIWREIQDYTEMLDNYHLYLQHKSLPTAVIKTDTNDENEMNTMRKYISTMVNSKGGAVFIDKDEDINFLQDGKDNISQFEATKESISRDIYSIFGINKIFDSSDTGSYAREEVNTKITYKNMDEFSKLINGTMNNLIQTIVDLNFTGVVKYPKFELDTLKQTNYKEFYNDILPNLGLKREGDVYLNIVNNTLNNYFDETYTVKHEDLEGSDTDNSSSNDSSSVRLKFP